MTRDELLQARMRRAHSELADLSGQLCDLIDDTLPATDMNEQWLRHVESALASARTGLRIIRDGMKVAA